MLVRQESGNPGLVSSRAKGECRFFLQDVGRTIPEIRNKHHVFQKIGKLRNSVKFEEQRTQAVLSHDNFGSFLSSPREIIVLLPRKSKIHYAKFFVVLHDFL